jgi:hypothetical protein
MDLRSQKRTFRNCKHSLDNPKSRELHQQGNSESYRRANHNGRSSIE